MKLTSFSLLVFSFIVGSSAFAQLSRLDIRPLRPINPDIFTIKPVDLVPEHVEFAKIGPSEFPAIQLKVFFKNIGQLPVATGREAAIQFSGPEFSFYPAAGLVKAVSGAARINANEAGFVEILLPNGSLGGSAHFWNECSYKTFILDSGHDGSVLGRVIPRVQGKSGAENDTQVLRVYKGDKATAVCP